MGLFDYVEHPEAIFAKVAELSPRKFIASFPAFTLVWGVQRYVRYHWIRKCPIYNYTRGQVELLYRNAGFDRVRIEQRHAGFIASGERTAR
jgi:hypothetical protein